MALTDLPPDNQNFSFDPMHPGPSFDLSNAKSKLPQPWEERFNQLFERRIFPTSLIDPLKFFIAIEIQLAVEEATRPATEQEGTIIDLLEQAIKKNDLKIIKEIRVIIDQIVAENNQRAIERERNLHRGYCHCESCKQEDMDFQL